MNIEDRIERRLQWTDDTGVIRDAAMISPVTHLETPTGRGPTFERLLDALDPSFTGSHLPDVYVWGPKGAGKSAVVTALFDRLADYGRRSRGVIHTSTRASAPGLPEYVYVDARSATTTFGLYHDVLAALLDDPVPEQGVGTEALERRLKQAVASAKDGIVVAVDHVDEPETHAPAEIANHFASFSDLSVLVVSRTPPADVDWSPDATVRFEAYQRHGLIDVITNRVTNGLERDTISHEQVRDVAEWAGSDAHDALAAIFGAAVLADDAGDASVRPSTLDRGIDAVPKPSAELGRVLALPANRQRVLRELIDLSDTERESVDDVTTAIAAADRVDLSALTIKRVLYELAEVNIVRRETVETSKRGRPPSRIDPQFPTLVFRELYDRGVDAGGR